MGGMAGLEYRAEDRMFYNKNMSSQPGNVWGELRPKMTVKWSKTKIFKAQYNYLCTAVVAEMGLLLDPWTKHLKCSRSY